jgi:hypothetical protein
MSPSAPLPEEAFEGTTDSPIIDERTESRRSAGLGFHLSSSNMSCVDTKLRNRLDGMSRNRSFMCRGDRVLSSESKF